MAMGFVKFEVGDQMGPARGFCATAFTPPEPLTGTHRPEMSCHSSASFGLMCLKTLDFACAKWPQAPSACPCPGSLLAKYLAVPAWIGSDEMHG